MSDAAVPALSTALSTALPAAFFDDPRMLAPRRVERRELAGGAFVLRSPVALETPARCIGQWLERWAAETPDAVAVAEPEGGGWRRLAWRQLRRQVGGVAQALLNLGLPSGPVVVLSDNGIDHLVLMLAALHVGRPVCTVSSGYCRLAGGDFTRIHGILRTLRPALVYASDAAVYGPALQGAPLGAAPVVFSRGDGGTHAFATLADTAETPAVMQAYAAVTPDTHAKYLLTSGSTGTPKVVINTHRMLCANQQMLAQTLPFLALADEKPVLLDWLPWSHTFGGNHNLNLVLAHGGTLYIDDGRPLPGLIDKTLAHLRRDVQPTLYFNVPRGFEMMLPALEADDALAARFLGRLRMLFYAGAAMPASTWQRLEAVAARVRAEPLWMTTSWGSTETSPGVTFAHWRLDQAGVIGLPMPGVELKFVPNGGKLEMRVKGANVFPGYRDNDSATREAFDGDGFYRIGDAGCLRDPADPLQGVVFDGRVAEDFKLASGTWVSVGTLRVKVVSALAPLAQDVVVTGHDRSEIGLLVFLSEAGRALAPDALRERVRGALAQLAAEGAGSSQLPTRALVLEGAPSAAAGEITDKGYINQRLVLERRAADVQALYADGSDPRVVVAKA